MFYDIEKNFFKGKARRKDTRGAGETTTDSTTESKT